MLQGLNRLVKEQDFAALARSRKSVFGRNIGLKVRENRLPHSRFGVVVGLKVSKRANQRNLLKRRLREAIRLRLDQFKPGFDVMVLTQPSALPLTYRELEEQLLAACKKAGILK